jgi:type II secretory pathway pseudopilin PulG
MLKRTAQKTVGNPRKAEEGYVLLTLLLWVALLTITVALPMLTYYNTQMKRDREEELVHRGVEYERAIRKYYKKFGGYPATIEMLEDSNHIRCLRRRYQDPTSGKDFKLLHLADVMMAFGAGIAGGGIPGAQTLGQPVSSLNAPPPGNANTSSTGSDATATTSGDASQQSNNPGSGTTLPFASISGQPSQTLGGGGIVGVASTNTQESIRVYNKKDHYNEWLFAYNPSQDRGGLPKGPYQPSLQAILPGQLGLQPGAQNGLVQGSGPGYGQGTMPMGQATQPFPARR